jgi:hypothetical protein
VTPRLTHEPLPPYSFVPGLFPHPHSDAAGHRFGRDLPPGQPIVGDCWQKCERYLLGCDLFNYGYYWEAHEAWEAVWNACGRRGPVATLLKALIQLAVVGVKLRQGMPESAAWHASRAGELIDETQADGGCTRLLGLELSLLAAHARALRDQPPSSSTGETRPIAVLFPFLLLPGDLGAIRPVP